MVLFVSEPGTDTQRVSVGYRGEEENGLTLSVRLSEAMALNEVVDSNHVSMIDSRTITGE
jgi:hypothetical protein